MDASDLDCLKSFDMTEQEYHDHIEDMNGICLSCGEIKYGDVESDASEYCCDECGERSVHGMENALENGNLNITDQEE